MSMLKTSTPYFPYAFFEGNIIKTENANVNIMTNALQYGTGIFGGIRGYFNKKDQMISLFRITDHYQRFLNSLKILGVRINYSQKQLEEISIKLVSKNKPKGDVYLRPFAYASTIEFSPNLNRDQNFEFSLHVRALGEYLPVSKGLSVCVSSWRRISDNSIPSRAKISGSYVNSAFARGNAEAAGFEEAIMLTDDGHVAEGSAENLFIVREDKLITTEKADDVLEGITRKTVIQLATGLGIEVEERRIDRSELYVADEAFFSGTGVQVAWISSIDHRKIGKGLIGPISSKIQKLYFETVKGNIKKYQNWCTKLKVGK